MQRCSPGHGRCGVFVLNAAVRIRGPAIDSHPSIRRSGAALPQRLGKALLLHDAYALTLRTQAAAGAMLRLRGVLEGSVGPGVQARQAGAAHQRDCMLYDESILPVAFRGPRPARWSPFRDLEWSMPFCTCNSGLTPHAMTVQTCTHRESLPEQGVLTPRQYDRTA